MQSIHPARERNWRLINREGKESVCLSSSMIIWPRLWGNEKSVPWHRPHGNLSTISTERPWDRAAEIQNSSVSSAVRRTHLQHTRVFYTRCTHQHDRKLFGADPNWRLTGSDKGFIWTQSQNVVSQYIQLYIVDSVVQLIYVEMSNVTLLFSMIIIKWHCIIYKLPMRCTRTIVANYNRELLLHTHIPRA